MIEIIEQVFIYLSSLLVEIFIILMVYTSQELAWNFAWKKQFWAPFS